MEFRREMAAGAEDNSQGRYHDKQTCLPGGTGFLNRVGGTLESAVLFKSVHKDNKDSPTLTTSWSRAI
jgi:hypothetical protein